MKRYFTILIAVIFSLSVSAQVKQEVIASAGGYNTAGGISISWTLGETIIPTFTNGGLTLTHGFQQQLIVTTVEENIDILVSVKVYPNPVSDIITIKFEEVVESEITLMLLDSQGRVVKQDVVEATLSEKQINMQDVAAGIYYLRLTKGKLVNVYKVIKL